MAHLFVGQLPFAKFYDKDLRDLFEPFGNIVTATLVRHNGEAFITFKHTHEADKAIRVLHDQYIMPGRKNKLQVMYARGSIYWSWFGIQHNIYLKNLGKGKCDLAPFFNYAPPMSPEEEVATFTPCDNPILLTTPIADVRHRGIAGPLGEVFAGSCHSDSSSSTQSSSSTLSSTTTTSDLFSSDSTNSSSASSAKSVRSSKSRSGSKRTRSMRDAEENPDLLDDDKAQVDRSTNRTTSRSKNKNKGKGRSLKKKRKMRMQDEENIEVEESKSPTPEPVCVEPKLITKLFIGPPRHHHDLKMPDPSTRPLPQNQSILGRAYVTDPANVSSRMSCNNPYSVLPDENTQAQLPPLQRPRMQCCLLS